MKIQKNDARVIVAVHNTVVSDARVRKGAKTLHDNGFDVRLIGFGERAGADSIDGVPLHLVGKGALLHIYKAVQSTPCWTGRSAILAAAAAVGLLIFGRAVVLAGLFNAALMFWLITAFGVLLVVALASKNKVREVVRDLREKYAVPLGYGLISRKLAAAMASHGKAVVHAHDLIALMAAVQIKRADPDIVVIWDAHELYTELDYRSAHATAFIEKSIRDCAPFVDHFITINDSIADYYAKRFPALPSATVIMNATRRSRSAAGPKNTRLQKAAGIHEGQYVLLFQGGLGFGRGIDILLEAATDLPARWSIVFMGDGPNAKTIRRRARLTNQHRPAERPAIVLIPSAPYAELAQWTSGAKLGAIPYQNTSLNHFHCTPNKLWEYPNAGVPILASSLPEMANIIRKYDTGILIPLNFTANDINMALSDVSDENLDLMRKNCRRFGEIENWEKYEPDLLRVHTLARSSLLSAKHCDHL